MRYLIVGAGMSGRGFIPQFLNSDDTIIFLDINSELLDLMDSKKHYTIDYFGDHPAITVSNYLTVRWQDINQKFIDSLDFMLISVGMSNFKEVIDNLINTNVSKFKPIFLFENGIDPATNFESILCNTTVETDLISQVAIFTTTINNGIDIKSEYNLKLYYDSKRFVGNVPFKHAIPIKDFENLMRRKILTYNYLSAVIAYPGFFKGYEYLADATSDNDINTLMYSIKDMIDEAYSQEFNTTIIDQKQFSQTAIDKFSNPDIRDSIERNCRDAVRKLSINERLYGSYQILQKHNVKCGVVLDVIALAIRYAKFVEKVSEDSVESIISLFSTKDKEYLNTMVYREENV